MKTAVEDEARWSQLMAAAHRGDKRAYEQLLRELASVTDHYVRRHFGALSFREDCVQECLLAIHKGKHTYDPKRAFRPWFFTIVRNRVIDLLRSAYAGKEAPIMTVDNSQTHPDPSDELSAGDILSKLDANQRKALSLTKIHGYSIAEAAERSGITESAMKSRVSRAVRSVAHLLQQDRGKE